MLDPNLAAKIVFIAGLTNIFFLILIFFSCRCLSGKLIAPLMAKPWFRKFYQWHCWYWWGFFISVLIHSILALYVYGNPF
ncbi:MAG: hypothetical protein COT81_01050 [Candidatus Buchananbacteria bacterium CG10_big_fil_rev_8_21_14_0_10_42_9]|uniref:Ferric oxidoreductase domain-containing protein n=1 Tax=Candidatus Buchananbacteria bacterium CG10_big_fil_rev_8_21_14_0_10_42_9 TaxID=1974526 RepID=A0A2H0W289_9BACT|nr:MAG: hypothetical protein COT81_01050 [Candidatus Buchananbacteria bacterium CG10_big_fil_rev_8_21_14_0_10_42_9]